MQEANPIITKKNLFLDSNFEFKVKKDNNKLWKLRDGLTLNVEFSSQYEGILEYNIPAIMVDGYIDLREEHPDTIESTLKSQFGFEISTYALEIDEKLSPKALELKKKLLEFFERKEDSNV